MALVEQVAFRDVPPYLESAALVGPTHSPILDAMTTMEERERVEADYEWFRYSKFALPFLLFLGMIGALLILLSFWWGNTSFENIESGVPRQFEIPSGADDKEGGIPKSNRNLRISTFTIGFFALIGIILTMYVKPAPGARKGLYMVFAVFLFIAGILGAISGALDIGNVTDAKWCRSRERGTVGTVPDNCYNIPQIADAVTITELFFAVISIFTALVLIIAAAKSFSEPKEEDEFGQEPIRRGVSRTTRECLLILMFINFVLLTCIFVFTIILHQGRDIRFMDEAFGTRTYNNLKPGWPIKNTRLRIATGGAVVGMVLLNLIPFRSRVFAYVCAFVYLLCSGLAIVVFALDVKAVDTARSMYCPPAYDCTYGPFITTCVFDIFFCILLVLYVIFEFVARLLMECKHCTRNYGFFEIKKHESDECSSRPVRCEICSKGMKAKEFVYRHRFECGHDSKRCDQCGAMTAEWASKAHQNECPKWPVKCTMCDFAFAREDLPAHVAACPMTPAACEACGETFRSADLSAHLATCSERQVACSKCSQTMPMYRFEAHSLQCC